MMMLLLLLVLLTGAQVAHTPTHLPVRTPSQRDKGGGHYSYNHIEAGEDNTVRGHSHMRGGGGQGGHAAAQSMHAPSTEVGRPAQAGGGTIHECKATVLEA